MSTEPVQVAMFGAVTEVSVTGDAEPMVKIVRTQRRPGRASVPAPDTATLSPAAAKVLVRVLSDVDDWNELAALKDALWTAARGEPTWP